jgi:uncharacterized DUF497 family protein
VPTLFFEWDETKAKANFRKHRVSFEEASTVFGDPLSLTIDDSIHSEEESRFVTVGKAITARLFVVIHSDRGEYIRIISARKATRHERKQYED